jgi:hypothetical protein
VGAAKENRAARSDREAFRWHTRCFYCWSERTPPENYSGLSVLRCSSDDSGSGVDHHRTTTRFCRQCQTASAAEARRQPARSQPANHENALCRKPEPSEQHDSHLILDSYDCSLLDRLKDEMGWIIVIAHARTITYSFDKCGSRANHTDGRCWTEAPTHPQTRASSGTIMYSYFQYHAWTFFALPDCSL